MCASRIIRSEAVDRGFAIRGLCAPSGDSFRRGRLASVSSSICARRPPLPACCSPAHGSYNPRCINQWSLRPSFAEPSHSDGVRRFDGGHVDRISVEDPAFIKEKTTMRCLLGLCVVLATWRSLARAAGEGVSNSLADARALPSVRRPPRFIKLLRYRPRLAPHFARSRTWRPRRTYTAPMQPGTTYTMPSTHVGTYPRTRTLSVRDSLRYQMTTPAYSNAHDAGHDHATARRCRAIPPCPRRRRIRRYAADLGSGSSSGWRQQAMPSYTTLPGYTTARVQLSWLFAGSDHGQSRDDVLHIAGRHNSAKHGHRHNHASHDERPRRPRRQRTRRRV